MAGAREANRTATMKRIVKAARSLLRTHGEFSLRAVAAELEMTPPALYRYVASHEDLVRTVALAVDADAGRALQRAADRQSADDVPARLIASGVAFRQWALKDKAEFGLVFTNIDVDCIERLGAQSAIGLHFSDLFATLWAERQFDIPALSSLDPGLAEILRDPVVPADLSRFPDELRGLIWVLQRAWAALYGTVTLEVYGHIDPRLVDQGHLFRAMISDQAIPLGLTDEMPRLLALLDTLL